LTRGRRRAGLDGAAYGNHQQDKKPHHLPFHS